MNYFLSILGETLQRMEDPGASYSIALPDLPQFKRLWERLPNAAKARTGISALFVRADGDVTEIRPAAADAAGALEEIADLADAVRRRLLTLLDWVDGKPSSKDEKGQDRIARLTTGNKIPRLVASCMRFVLAFRNAVVYDHSKPSLLEVAAWRAAWGAVLEWARARNYHA